MNVLLLYPKFPRTFWGFNYAIPFIGKKATFPPLGLLTVAALLPKEWNKKLVDLNVQNLNEDNLHWADLVFVSAMTIQKESVMEIISLAKRLGKKIVAGGPLFTTDHEEFLEEIDHFVLGEAEASLPLFLEDLNKNSLKKVYKTASWPDITKTPIPLWELIDKNKYASMDIQYSRGCPFNCEFCDIVFLNGRMPRTKDKNQIIRELDALYAMGWRDSVFLVDDNFIGNKAKLKREILPAIIEWMEKRNHPFTFDTQASINIADDKELMELMFKAGFNTVFVGIESTNEESLHECGKLQNTKRNLLDSIKAIQSQGISVSGGFIIGFDKDKPSTFNRTYSFIQKSGIGSAMVGLLQAGSKTKLWERLNKEKRILHLATGINTDSAVNFIPKMNRKSLIEGYKNMVSRLYSPKNYHQRMKNFLKYYNSRNKRMRRLNINHFFAFLKSIWILGIREKERFYYWRILIRTLFKNPKLFPIVVDMSIKGYHFRKMSEECCS